ncbi:DUF7125 family protein [Salinibaculum rarum]|uniref:DUF7125 family protein n=1 Tax=Salinibaculum rarum TaxID=3058903 RepID=UPI0026605959|nr:hypothetical protein [Salinibaculum sp. KK48]
MAAQEPVYDSLSTGIDNFDSVLEEDGFVPGSTITVVADPASVGDLLVYNFTGGRDTFYLTTARREDDVKGKIRAAGNERAEIEYFGLEDQPVIESAANALREMDVDEQSTIVVDPVNSMEDSPGVDYREFLAGLNDLAVRTGSLVVLLCLQEAESSDVPVNRWRTKHMSDSVFKVIHNVSTNNVEDYLTLEKLSPEQNLVDESMRVFKLPRELDMDIDTKKNMSP